MVSVDAFVEQDVSFFPGQVFAHVGSASFTPQSVQLVVQTRVVSPLALEMQKCSKKNTEMYKKLYLKKSYNK